MATAMAELPLALFSTLAPMGAGAFVILAVLFSTAKIDGDALKRIDKMTAIPVALVIVGFIAAFFHLASPLNAFGVFAGIGASPLSNELVAGCVFAVVMLVYWIWAMTGTMSAGARKGLAWATAVLGVVFAWFTGMAYMIDTIPSWNTLAGPIQMVGFALVGGAAVAILTLTLAKSADALKAGTMKTTVLVVLVAGIVLGLGGLAAQAAATSGMGNALVSGADLVGGALMIIICGAAVLAIVGILLLRLAFYAMQLSVGLSIM